MTAEDRKPFLITVMILGVGLTLRLLCYTGGTGSDDAAYVRYADQIARGVAFSDLNHYQTRLLFMGLLSIPMKLWGTAVAVRWLPLAILVVSWLTDVVVVLFCWRRFSRLATMLVAAILAVSAGNMVCPSMMFPDNLLVPLGIAAVGFMIESFNQATAPSRSRLFVVGLLFGTAAAMRETGTLFFPPCFIYMAWALREQKLTVRLSCLAFVLLGLSVMGLVDAAAFQLIAGDWAWPLKAAATVAPQLAEEMALDMPTIHTATGVMWVHILSVFRYGDLTRATMFILVPAGLCALFVPGGRIYASCGLFYISFFILGSASLTQYVQVPADVRYLQPAIPLLTIALAIVFDHTSRHLTPGRIYRLVSAAGIVGFLVCMNLPPALCASGGFYFAQLVRQSVALGTIADADAHIYYDSHLLLRIENFVPHEMRDRLAAIPAQGPFPHGLYVPAWGKAPPTLSADIVSDIQTHPIRYSIGDCRNSALLWPDTFSPSAFLHYGGGRMVPLIVYQL